MEIKEKDFIDPLIQIYKIKKNMINYFIYFFFRIKN